MLGEVGTMSLQGVWSSESRCLLGHPPATPSPVLSSAMGHSLTPWGHEWVACASMHSRP